MSGGEIIENLNNKIIYKGINVGRRDVLEIVNKDNVFYWSEYIKHYYEKNKHKLKADTGYSKNAIYDRSIEIIPFIEWLYQYRNDKSLVDVTEEDLIDFASDRKELYDNSPRTIYKILCSVLKVFEFMCASDYIKSLPVSDASVIVKSKKRDKLNTTFLTQSQIDKIKIELPEHKLYIMFSLSSGAKIHDIHKLKWNDIDFENRLAIVNGENLYFSREVAELLEEEYLRRIDENINDYGYVFRKFIDGKCISKDKPIGYCTTSKWCTEIGECLGILNFRHLDFRHTAIRLFLSASGSIGMTSIIMNYPFLSPSARLFANEDNNDELIAKYKDICEL